MNRLNAKGAPDFVVLEAEKIYALTAAKFEEETGRTLSPSQTETYMISALAYALTVRAAEEQLAFESNFVAYARGDWLDWHGAGRNTPRLEASPALTRLRFSRAAPAVARIAIPAGVRVTDQAAGVRFRTTAHAAIDVGETTVEVAAEAETAGLFANGWAEGSLDTMIDAIPGIEAVANIEATAGGADREDDQRYRARIAQAFERINRGGSRAAYITVVSDWSARVIDVEPVRPTPGHIHIYPLMDSASGAPTPTEAESAALLEWVAANRVPQGDYVSIMAPVADQFQFALSLVLSDPSAQARAEAAVDDVLAAWRRKLGGFIAPSDLICAARLEDGVIDADIPGLEPREIAATSWRDGVRLETTVELR